MCLCRKYCSITVGLAAFCILCACLFAPRPLISVWERLQQHWSQDSWSELLSVVEVESTVDGHVQLAYAYQSPSEVPMPLIVSLHTWSSDYSRYDVLSEMALRRGFNYIHPNFRGANNRPISCASPEAIADIDDAITYCLSNWDVDADEIYVVGASGGGHAVCSLYFKTKHAIRSFYAWVPITDLEAWYYQSKHRKLNYWADIEQICGGSFNAEVARERSPIHMESERRPSGKLHLFAGIDDGYTGSVPISHSIRLFNRLCRDYDLPNQQLALPEVYALLTRASSVTGEFIGGRAVYFKRELRGFSLTIFDGGHELLPSYQEERIVTDLFAK